MRKVVIVAALAAIASAPFVANATVLPSAVVLQDTAGEPAPAPIHVKKHSNFLPIALVGAAIIGGGTALATSGGGNGNSPS
jgi:hypothetical protein